MLQLVGNTFNRMAQSGAQTDDIMTASWPWPELQETNLSQYLGQSLPMIIMVGISVVMVAPTFVVSIVKERQVSDAGNLMGANIPEYSNA